MSSEDNFWIISKLTVQSVKYTFRRSIAQHWMYPTASSNSIFSTDCYFLRCWLRAFVQIKLELPAEAPLGGATTVAPCTKGYKIGATSRSATNGGATKVALCAKGLIQYFE
jgi:hypothetical protein